MEVLVTNDDGHDSPGLHALVDSLDEIGDVSVLAPAEDHSGVGRLRSDSVSVREAPTGRVVTGTPADCVIVGLEGLDLDPDLVVAGCNVGANVGAYTLGRSGTVSAAIEGAFRGVPAIALSLYVPEDRWPLRPTRKHFTEAVHVGRYLATELAQEQVLPDDGLLNVNVPLGAPDPLRLRVTTPSPHHPLTVEENGDELQIRDGTWDLMASGEWEEESETDRGAILDGAVSVTPLTAHHERLELPSIESLLGAYHHASRDVDGTENA